MLGLLVGAGFASGCGRTVNDYLREAQSGSPEAVSDAVDNISDLLERKEITGVPFDDGDRAALEYLKTVARESSVHTNRATALGGLGKLKSVDSPKIFLDALEDGNWLVRLKAARALRHKGNEESVSVIVESFKSERRAEVRRVLVGTLSEIGGETAIGALFETFLSGSNRQREEDVLAWQALKKLTGLDYSIHDRSDWKEAFEERFGSSEKKGGETDEP